MTISPEHLFARLSELGIETQTVQHEPVFTVEQSKGTLAERPPGGHTKNLFLRNKKGRMWLLVMDADTRVDLRGLAQEIGSGRLGFASEERLLRYLGVTPGSVTPFGVIADEERAVTLLLDESLLEHELLNFHPLDNSMTTTIKTDDLIRFLTAEGHEPSVVSVPSSDG